MKMIKRALSAVLILLVIAAAASGCKKSGQDDGTLSVLVKNTEITEALKKQFPDIPFDFQYYDGKNTTSNLQMLIKKHDISDIYFGTLPLDPKDAKDNLLDLSGYEFCSNFDPSILNQYDVDGHIYQIPTGITMRCIIYNKELFDTCHYEEPKNFSELTALCRQIRKEHPDTTPIVFGGAGIGYYFTTMTTYAQAETLYTLEGQKNAEAYLSGSGSSEACFGDGIRMVQELIDAGAFDASKNENLWDTEVFHQRMETGEAFMQFAWGAQYELFRLVNENPHRYAVMPFRNSSGNSFIGTGISYNIGLSKALEKPENKKKLENALRVMEWFSTEEGQSHLTTSEGSIIFPLRDAKNEQTFPKFREFWNENLDGIKAPMLYVGYEDIIIQTAEYILDTFNGQHNLDELVPLIDDIHQAALHEDTGNRTAYAGEFSRNFTHEETVQMMAEIIHSAGNSDITLVSDGNRTGDTANTSGVHSRFYEGALPYDWMTIFIPGTNDADNSIVYMTLKGSDIRKLIENGKAIGQSSSVYPYYWAGMTVSKKDDEIISMTLADGTPVEPDRTYTVSFAEGDYTDELKEKGQPEMSGNTLIPVFREYLRLNSPLKPPKTP